MASAGARDGQDNPLETSLEMTSTGRYETYTPPEDQEEGSVWTLPALRGLRVVMWRFQVSAPVPCSCAHMHDKGH